MSELDIQGIYESCAPMAFRRARALLADDSDAWDVVHEVFERLALTGERFRGDAHPMTWLYRAVTNACINRWKQRGVRHALLRAHGLTASISFGAEADAGAVEAREVLAALWDRLDDTDRQIVILRYQDDLPQEEIAEVLGVWRRTVGRRLAKITSLAKQLAEVPA